MLFVLPAVIEYVTSSPSGSSAKIDAMFVLSATFSATVTGSLASSVLGASFTSVTLIVCVVVADKLPSLA